MRSDNNGKNIFADRNKYEGNIFKKFGRWFKGLKGYQKGIFILIIVLLIVAVAAGSYIYSKLNQVKKVELTLDETELSCVDVDGYINILMLGVDSRDMSKVEATNTDAIMIISINEKTWDVNLISVYRDTYLKIGEDDYYNKINSAFAQGGAATTIKSLNQAMDLNISKYVLVNFKAVADLVNAVDGITVDVKEEEIEQLNKYTRQTANNIGQKKYNIVKKAGKQKLEGVQAVSYGRIRKGVGDDYKRTSRMRVVLKKVTNKLKSASVSQLNDIINLMSKECQTNLSNSDILGLAARITKYNFKGSTGWPYNVTGGMLNEISYVFPDDLANNTKLLHEKMFGQKDYKVSDTVTTISNAIAVVVSGAGNAVEAVPPSTGGESTDDSSQSTPSTNSSSGTNSSSSGSSNANKSSDSSSSGSSSSSSSSGSSSSNTPSSDTAAPEQAAPETTAPETTTPETTAPETTAPSTDSGSSQTEPSGGTSSSDQAVE